MKLEYSYYKNEIKSLFKEIFKETDSFCEMIFENKLSESDIFGEIIGKELAAITFAIPFFAKVKNKKEKCIYIYGVGVKDKYRGNGISKKIIDEIYDYYKNKNVAFLYLVPADKNLFYMYEKMGFSTEFYLNVREYNLKNVIPFLYDIKDGDFYNDYEEYIKKFDTVILRSKKDNEIMLKYTTYKKAGESGFLFEVSDDTAYIRESFIYDEDELYSFLCFLKNNGCKKAVVINCGHKKNPYAMVKKYTDIDLSGGYTNMNFD